ncbi:quinone oxidoreductase family protein [Mucilaginibacter lappiensis]|uniref:NADPH:quinone reductase-like Zn-dependent oxidoreductase n=1 Tax=Mucilaginibacter lappiensis TaxID=354630 RepID=A0A1N7ERE7_9SPHI|nr:zinc-binding alcohol dehydrogenase family protein [Mucilaginibacter lappiensis]MBB6111935.1 NADPH:quinone reductase-like Zn-dependent oxidoreductase [Mucilaginibacter lappiensis]MBB6126545.1 NADPH:quinone reductase-like Zn-dependent oxidoreductase [Mucilaginibacter lappiensis]SIR90640.1 NADPH:quinone reductase [Mucilaginibacter lappiensis]
MKAAVLYKAGETPKYADFAEPIPASHEQLINIKAASIKNLDKMRAKGAHYDKHENYPVVVGVDGAGLLADGTRVYAGSATGMMSEKALINKHWYVPIPDGLDDVTAAALPNPAISAWLSLVYKGKLKKGGTVLILGATGITGKLAIQLAQHLGAGRIIAISRNQEALDNLDADVTISLNQSDNDIKQAIKTEAAKTPFDVVIDYLWGKPAELLLAALTGHNLNATVDHTTRYVQVGEMAGSAINLPAAILRSTAIELTGAGGGSISKEVIGKIQTEILPEVFKLALEGKLSIDTLAIPLKDVAEAWQQDARGKRVVITM